MIENLFNFLAAWSQLIFSVFARHTLTAIVVLLVLAGGFLYLERENRFVNKWATLRHCLLALLAFAVILPIVGVVADVVGDLFDVLNFLWVRLAHQPVLFVILTMLCAALPFVWEKIPNLKMRPMWIRITVSVVFFFVLVGLLVPLFNLFE